MGGIADSVVAELALLGVHLEGRSFDARTGGPLRGTLLESFSGKCTARWKADNRLNNCFFKLEQEANIKYSESHRSKQRLHAQARRARSTKITRQIGISTVTSKKSQSAVLYADDMMERLKTVIYETASSLLPKLLAHHQRCHPTRLAYATEGKMYAE